MGDRQSTVEKDRPLPTITIMITTTTIIINITTATLITSSVSAPRCVLLGQNLVQQHHNNHGDQGVCYLGRIWYNNITTTTGTKVRVTWAESGTTTSQQPRGPRCVLLGQNLVQQHHNNHGDQGACYLGRIWYNNITTTTGTKVCVTWAESGTTTSQQPRGPRCVLLGQNLVQQHHNNHGDQGACYWGRIWYNNITTTTGTKVCVTWAESGTTTSQQPRGPRCVLLGQNLVQQHHNNHGDQGVCYLGRIWYNNITTTTGTKVRVTWAESGTTTSQQPRGPRCVLLGQNLVQQHHNNHGDQGACYLGRIWYNNITTTTGTKVCVTWAESGTTTSQQPRGPRCVLLGQNLVQQHHNNHGDQGACYWGRIWYNNITTTTGTKVRVTWAESGTTTSQQPRGPRCVLLGQNLVQQHLRVFLLLQQLLRALLHHTL